METIPEDILDIIYCKLHKMYMKELLPSLNNIERKIKSRDNIKYDVYMNEIFMRTYNDWGMLINLTTNFEPYSFTCKIMCDNHDIDIMALKISFPKYIECVKYICNEYIIGILKKNYYWFILTPELEVHIGENLSDILVDDAQILKHLDDIYLRN